MCSPAPPGDIVDEFSFEHVVPFVVRTDEHGVVWVINVALAEAGEGIFLSRYGVARSVVFLEAAQDTRNQDIKEIGGIFSLTQFATCVFLEPRSSARATFLAAHSSLVSCETLSVLIGT